MSTDTLGWTLCGVLLASFLAWLAYVKPWRKVELASPVAPADGVPVQVGAGASKR
jgi:hypothetical protein